VTAPSQQGASRAQRLGVASGSLVQSINADEDVPTDLLDELRAVSGEELISEDSDEVVDVVLLWWREDDGDLIGREGHVEPSDILEAVPTAGLVQTGNLNIAQEWNGTKLGAPRGGHRKQR